MKSTLGIFAALGLCSAAASAYPTMIRNGYTQCATCHTDPSGGTLLTAYGRAQSELLLSSRWGKANEADPSPASNFLFGVFKTPDSVALGGWVRQGYIWNTVDGTLVDNRELQMRASLAGDVRVGPVRAAAELGYADANTTQLAAITRNQNGANLVSREHWIGLELADGAALIRAGRINVPFGLRNLEHPSFVRTATQTDINEDQQYGVSVALSNESWRGEVMAILGNYSLRPDAFRQRGFAGYVERALSSNIAVGLNALVTRVDVDLDTRLPTLRQAYGVTARAAPWQPLALSAEIDALVSSNLGSRGVNAGYAGWLQADLEILRGVHLVPAAERLRSPAGGDDQVGWWGGIWWFVVPHLDVRADVIRRSSASSPTTDTFLIQLNGYL
ncbi:MAG TPA: hypothetical protein VG496_05460 [Myxococcales bacterium]|nr:hypothetical protein [Myxococcales bacterium]